MWEAIWGIGFAARLVLAAASAALGVVRESQRQGLEESQRQEGLEEREM